MRRVAGGLTTTRRSVSGPPQPGHAKPSTRSVLFDIERALKDADLETRRRVRATDTRDGLDRIHAWLVGAGA
jgi:hypothetical protein